MAYTTPKTWQYKETISSADLNKYIRDNSNAIRDLIRDNSNAINAIRDLIYPIGTIYENGSNGTNPAALLGFGVWELHGVGRSTVCINSADGSFNTVGNLYGEKDHALTGNESGLKGHNHSAFSSGHSEDHSHTITTRDGDGVPGGYADIGQSNSPGSSFDSGETSNDHSHGITVNAVGASNASYGHNTFHPVITTYRWIRTS